MTAMEKRFKTEHIITMTVKSKKRVEAWIGMVQVMPTKAGLMSNASGAFTNALALVSSRKEYESEVRKQLRKLAARGEIGCFHAATVIV